MLSKMRKMFILKKKQPNKLRQTQLDIDLLRDLLAKVFFFFFIYPFHGRVLWRYHAESTKLLEPARGLSFLCELSRLGSAQRHI